MKKIIVPVINLPKLEKRVKSISKKTNKIHFKINEESIFVKYDSFHNIECKEVEIEGKYVLEGWVFIGKIEHTPFGNIIYNITSIKVPNYFRNMEPKCDHCGVKRYRAYTYIVYNEINKEFKQIGKSCLNDFIGIDLEVVCENLTKIIDLDIEKEYNLENTYNNMFDPNIIKDILFTIIKKEGYNKNIDLKMKIKEFIENYNNKYIPENSSDIKEMDEWVNNLNLNNDFYYNASIAWKLKTIKSNHFKIIAALINSYLKYKVQYDSNKKLITSFIGKVGDKVELKINSLRVLFTSCYSYGYKNTINLYTYEIIDENNNYFIWKTNSKDLKVGDIIKGTIKGYKEYKGIRQNILTRCKII